MLPALPRKQDVIHKVKVMKARQRRDEIAPLPITPDQVSGGGFPFEWALFEYDGVGSSDGAQHLDYAPGVNPRFTGSGGVNYDDGDNGPANAQWGDDGYFLHLRGRLNLHGAYWHNGDEILRRTMTARVLSNQPRVIKVYAESTIVDAPCELHLTTEILNTSAPTAEPNLMRLHIAANFTDIAPGDLVNGEIRLGSFYNADNGDAPGIEDGRGELRLAWS